MRICPECRTTYHENAPVCPKDGASLLELGDDDARCGAVIDERFLILSRLGEGGMGTVYRAWQFSTGRMVALKLLIAAFSDNKTAVERFMREARVTAGLNSPHVVRVYDFGQLDDGTAYMAMELVDGVPLDALIDGPMPPERAMELVRQICIALEEAHGQGLVHRDLKPGNIMVRQLADGGDFAQVLDFGIAKILDETRTALTAENQNPGTPAYMSPEQARNEAIGPPTDLYALSVIFFEMLVGERPFTGTSAMSVLLQHVQKAPPSLSERRPELPRVEALDAVIQRGLAKDPTVRYGTAAALRGELDTLKSGADPDALSNPITAPDEGKRKFGFNMQALGCSVQLAVAVGALALFILPAMRDGSDRFVGDDAPTASMLDAPASEAPQAKKTQGVAEVAPPETTAPPAPPKPVEEAEPAKMKRGPVDEPAAAPEDLERDAKDDDADEGRSDETPAEARLAGGGAAALDGKNARIEAAPTPEAKPPAVQRAIGAVSKQPGRGMAGPIQKVRPKARSAQPARATDAEVRRGLQALAPRIRARCGPGPWPIEVLVDMNGSVQRARITQPGRAAHAKAKCVLRELRSARLPRPAKPLPLVLTL